MPSSIPTNPKIWIESLITDFVNTSPVNHLGLMETEPAFDRPMVGFSSAADPIYSQYKAHIGDFYLMPAEIFEKAFPQNSAVQPEAVTVISWILPSTTATRAEQSTQTKYPAERWGRTRLFGEQFNEALRQYVVEQLKSVGVSSVAPLLSPFWSRYDQGFFAPCSNWSERHAAYAAGLGTFGLCDGLITTVGKAVRIGSVVAHLHIDPTPRPYHDHHAYCLYYSHGTCGKCIARCPVNAITKEGHDKKRCMQYTEFTMNTYLKKTYGIDSYACGLCQCNVPCMDHIPAPDEG